MLSNGCIHGTVKDRAVAQRVEWLPSTAGKSGVLAQHPSLMDAEGSGLLSYPPLQSELRPPCVI